MITFENKDCLKAMDEIAEESVDLLLTDCPYRLVSGGDSSNCFGGHGMTGAFSKAQGGKLARQGKIFEHNDIEFSEWLPKVYRVLKDGSHAYIMINGRNLKDLWQEAEKVGFKWQNIIIWDKGTCTPNKWYMNGYEMILMLRKGRAKTINDMGAKNILKVPPVQWRIHPTEKPVELLKTLILNSTQKGDLVLDPFAGSASTAIACMDTDRNFIGFEIDEKFFKLAEQRIKDEQAQIRMF